MPKASLSEDTLLQQLIAAIQAMVARLNALRAAGNYQQALAVIDQNLEELLGLQAGLIRQLDDGKLVEMLTTNEYLDVGRLYNVAEVFYQDGIIRLEMGDTELAHASRVRSLDLFLEVGFAVENDFLEADERIDVLSELLGTDIPENTLFKLFDYYEQVGAFDLAEAALNRMLNITGGDPAVVAEKRNFYQRLLTESDEELQAGGLPREVILQRSQSS